jgi:hypothetical protein
MKAELDSADTSILDHSVESVLPGVHEYLTSLHTELRATRTDVSGLTRKVESCSDSKIRKAVQETVSQCLAPFSSLASSLNLMAASLRSGLQTPTAIATIASPLPQSLTHPQAPDPMDEDEEDEDGNEISSPGASLPSRPPRLQDVRGHHPKPHYASLNELYNEFYGLGEFQDKPVPGGLAKLEECFKTKWRQGFSGGQKKEWSRLTTTIRGINVHIEELGGDIEKAIDNLDIVFQDKEGANRTISKMVAHMQERGMLTKGRARGRYAPANGSAV